jgi:hypothetical protein
MACSLLSDGRCRFCEWRIELIRFLVLFSITGRWKGARFMKLRKFHTIFAATTLIMSALLSAAALRANTLVVPTGTEIRLVLESSLSTETNKVRDPFAAEVAEDVVIGGQTMIARGARVHGEISRIETPKRLAGLTGKASMVLRFDNIHTSSGDEALVASLVSVSDPANTKQKESVKREGKVEATADTKGMIAKGTIGVAAGTVLGAIFGNVSRGLLLGSIGGAAAILAPKGKDVTLEHGTGLVIRLDRNLEFSSAF